jgi:moderate conductance mechanosensitive channel
MWLWVKLFGSDANWHVAVGALLTAFVTAGACAEVVTTVVRRSLPAANGGDERRRRARATVRLVRILLLLLLTILFVPPVMDLFGRPLSSGLRLRSLADWIFGSGLKIFFITMFAYVVTRIIDLATTRFERHLADQPAARAEEYAKRARTLGDMTRNVTTAIVVTVAAIYVLQELNFNPLPLITGAGILGLAFGFGAQTLVKDVISGFFLILENQIRVGDVAEINGVGGLVEALHLRTIILRDQRGAVHVFPCGAISSLANLTKDFAYAVLDIRVHYRHDTDHVIDVLKSAASTIHDDPAFAGSVFSPLEVLGVESLGDMGVTIRVRLKTLPLRQWEVARELRRRIKKSFDDAGIEIPVVQPITSSTIAKA